jgi:hypothetical protein
VSRRLLALAAATFAAACHPAVDMPGVPLYPNGATTRLPRSQIAQIAGPIERIDGQDLLAQGGVFDLLPGCHVVELDTRPTTDSYALSSGLYLPGHLPFTIYAIQMKPGARYIIRRDIYSSGVGAGASRITVSAHEEQANGAMTELEPVKSEMEIKACRR